MTPRKPQMTDKGMSWFKFSPRRWRGDEDLRPCSLAARGLWIDLLGFAHEANPYGHVLINGKVPTVEQIAKKVGATVKEVTALLTELEESGVFSRTADGVIYSRGMVRDKQRSELGRFYGNKSTDEPGTLLGEGRPPETPGGVPSPLPPPPSPPRLNGPGHPSPPPHRVTPPLESESESESKAAATTGSSQSPSSAGARRKLLLDKFADAIGVPVDALTTGLKWQFFASAHAGWIEAGADEDADIWPTIRDRSAHFKAGSGTIPDGPAYYTKAILEARDKRLAAPPAKRYPLADTKGTDDYWNHRLDLFAKHKFWADYEDGPEPGKIGCKVPNRILEARARQR